MSSAPPAEHSASEARAADFDHLFKVVIIGESGVGKSSLLLRYTENSFSDMYISTIGVDFKFRLVKVDGSSCKLQIWDTAGQERFRNITSSFFRGAHGVVLVYDVTSRASFDSLRSWFEDLDRHYGRAAKKPCVVVVGNKFDMEDQRKVSLDEANQLCDRYRAKYPMLELLETSAKEDVAVEAAFQKLVRLILQGGGKGEVPGSQVVLHAGGSGNSEDAPSNSSCC